MKALLFLCLFICLCSGLINEVNAKQITFSKQEKDENYQFNYRWLDHEKKERHLSFQLSKDVLFNRFRNFMAYKPDIANLTINKYILKAWRKNPIPQSQLTLVKNQGTFRLKLTARNNETLLEAQKKLAELEAAARKKYLKKHFYHQFTTYDGKAGIKPDHSTIGQLMVTDFKPIKPLILEQVDLKNIRYATDYVLSFSQTIPYSPLESRMSSSGAGFNTPTKVLWENQGDCDSKVTLTAAMLRSLMPRVKMVLIFIDNHALIGIETRAQGNDITIEHERTTYILAEPTGPAILPLGKLAIDSEQAILNGLYSVEAFE